MMHVILPDQVVKFHSMHLKRIKGQVSLQGRLRPHADADLKFVFICFTNRCGSNFFAEAMASDGTLNLGFEFLNHDAILRVMREQNLEYVQDYISGVVANKQK